MVRIQKVFKAIFTSESHKEAIVVAFGVRYIPIPHATTISEILFPFSIGGIVRIIPYEPCLKIHKQAYNSLESIGC